MTEKSTTCADAVRNREELTTFELWPSLLQSRKACRLSSELAKIRVARSLGLQIGACVRSNGSAALGETITLPFSTMCTFVLSFCAHQCR